MEIKKKDMTLPSFLDIEGSETLLSYKFTRKSVFTLMDMAKEEL